MKIDLLRICKMAYYSDKQHLDSMPFASHGHWLASGKPFDFLQSYFAYCQDRGTIGMLDYFTIQTNGRIPPLMAPFYLRLQTLERRLFFPDNLERQKQVGFEKVLTELFLQEFKNTDRFQTGGPGSRLQFTNDW